jgi:hypothetical protein
MFLRCNVSCSDSTLENREKEIIENLFELICLRSDHGMFFFYFNGKFSIF